MKIKHCVVSSCCRRCSAQWFPLRQALDRGVGIDGGDTRAEPQKHIVHCWCCSALPRAITKPNGQSEYGGVDDAAMRMSSLGHVGVLWEECECGD